MKLQWHNPEKVPASKLPEGYRFALVEEIKLGSPLKNKCYPYRWHDNFEIDGCWTCNNKTITYCTAEPLPMSYLIGDAAEEFDDPAYRRSVKYYFEQGWEVESLYIFHDCWILNYSNPEWDWETYDYRLTGNKRKENQGEYKYDILHYLELAGKQWKRAEDILAEKAPEVSMPEVTTVPLKRKDFLVNGPWWIRSKKNRYDVEKLIIAVNDSSVRVIENTFINYTNLLKYYERSNDGISWHPCYYTVEEGNELSR